MAADSAITKLNANGSIIEVDQQGWLKIIRETKVPAVVGYWGFIGKINSGQFDQWLAKLIASADYSDLRSLAEAVAIGLNNACRNKPLADNEAAGIHVAGFQEWMDGQRRPSIFHVHNGPGYVQTEHVTQPLPQGERLIEVRPQSVIGPRTLFAAHQDFPSQNTSLEENVRVLEAIVTIRNGDFFYYSVVWDSLQRAFNYLNLIPGFSIPRDNSLGARKGLLVAALETTVRLYRCSNKSRIVGGKVVSEAIGANGFMN
jgi:hypothetical protein